MGNCSAGTDLGQPNRFGRFLDERQLALLHQKYPVGTFGEYVHRHRIGPVFVIGKAFRHRLWPVLHYFIGAENILSAFEARNGSKAGAWRRVFLRETGVSRNQSNRS